MTAAVVMLARRDDFWTCEIGEASDTVTICFEGSHNGGYWKPLNGERVQGPGPKIGNVYTNAVAGGPALFKGSGMGYKYIRAIMTRGDELVAVHLKSGSDTFNGVISPQNSFTFIIDEEKTLEESLNE